MGTLLKVFPTLILDTFVNECEEINPLLEEEAYFFQQNFSKTHDWRCDTYSSIGLHPLENGNNVDVSKKLLNILSEKVFEYLIEYGVDLSKSNISCDEYWFNIASSGQYQEYHQHHGSDISVVYYVKANDQSGNIVFKSFESLTCDTLKNIRLSEINYNTISFNPTPGRVLVFKSNLLHMVEKNLSNEDRISIALNFRVIDK